MSETNVTFPYPTGFMTRSKSCYCATTRGLMV